MSNKGILTNPTSLYYSADQGSTFTKLTRIKNFPDLGTEPTAVEVTDLEDEIQTFIQGIMGNDVMPFLANYTLAEFTTVKNLAGANLVYKIEFGTDGLYGAFIWTGSHNVRKTGGEVNSPQEMSISMYADSLIMLSTEWTYPWDVGSNTVTFTVNDGTNPIEDAEVRFNYMVVETDASGEAVFTNVADGTNQEYEVIKTGYATVSSAVDVSAATAETVSMTAI